MTYLCRMHGVRAQVVEEHRTASFSLDLQVERRTPHACWLAMNWPAVLQDEAAALGPHGPWHPRRKTQACLVVKEGA